MNIQDILMWGGGGAGALGILGFAARYGITMLNRQGLIQAGDTSQKQLLEALAAEAAKWQALHEEAQKQREETQRTNTILLVQNALLRALCIQHGVPMDQLDKLEKDIRGGQDAAMV